MTETPEEFAQQFDPCARGEFIGVAEAAKLIASRDAQIRQESKWISVKERLPEHYDHVLVYFCEDWNWDKLWNIGWAFYNSDGFFCYQDGIHSTVTHWTPLPEPPVDKEGEE